MTLPSAVLPCCVGKFVVVYFLFYYEYFVSAPLHSVFFLPLPPFPLHQRPYLCRLLLTIPAPFRLELHPINAI